MQDFFWDTLWIPVTVICFMFCWVIWQLTLIRDELQENRMDTVADLNAIRNQLVKAKSEIVGKIANLEQAVVASGTPSVEVANAVADLKVVAQALDDVVADAPAVVEEVAVEEPVVEEVAVEEPVVEEVAPVEETPAE